MNIHRDEVEKKNEIKNMNNLVVLFSQGKIYIFSIQLIQKRLSFKNLKP